MVTEELIIMYTSIVLKLCILFASIYMSDCLSRGHEFESQPILEMDHDIFLYSHTPSSANMGRAVKVHALNIVNCLGSLSLPRNSARRLTDRLDRI